MEWNKILQDALYLILTVLVPVLIKYAATYLSAKAKALNEQVNNQNIKKYIDVAVDAVEKAVLEVNQTYVDELKKNGSFTKEAHDTAKNMALEKAKAMLSDDCENIIKEIYGDFESWLNTNIEVAVNKNKIFSIASGQDIITTDANSFCI